MSRELAYDVCEMAATTYFVARDHGKPFTALPVFLTRGLHHRAVLAREPGDPKELEGTRVGVNRGYTVTTGVWARGILATEYGVDLDRITWVRSDQEHVAEFVPPANVEDLPAGMELADLGAAVGDVKSDELVPMIADADDGRFPRARRARALAGQPPRGRQGRAARAPPGPRARALRRLRTSERPLCRKRRAAAVARARGRGHRRRSTPLRPRAEPRRARAARRPLRRARRSSAAGRRSTSCSHRSSFRGGTGWLRRVELSGARARRRQTDRAGFTRAS